MSTIEKTPSASTPLETSEESSHEITAEMDSANPEVAASVEKVKELLKRIEEDPRNAEVYVRMYNDIEQSPREAVRKEQLDAMAQRAFGTSLVERAELYSDARRRQYAEEFGIRALEDEEATVYNATGSIIKRGFKRIQPEDWEKARKELLTTVAMDPTYTADDKALAEYFRLSEEFKAKARELVTP